jgi:hypothetical protein
MAITNNMGRCDFVGCVLETYNSDYRAMSDVYTWATFALVWTGSEAREVLVNANFECDQSGGAAVVDATPEVVAEWNAWKAAKEARANEARLLRAEMDRQRELVAPKKGRMVEVVKGRKVPVGTAGLVFWEGTDNYGNAKLGLATSNRKTIRNGRESYADVVWVAASNCRAFMDQATAMEVFLAS